MILKIKIIILVFVLAFFACNDANPLLDAHRDLLNTYGEIHSDTLTAISDTFIVKGKVNTGGSTKLLLGSYKDYESRFLVKFDSLPENSISVDTLRLRISSQGKFGSSLEPTAGTVYRVIEEWDESVNADENWDFRTKIDYSPQTTKDFVFSAEDSATFTLDLPTTLIDIWRDSTSGSQNFGLLFDFNQADFIREFVSSDMLDEKLVPQLIYIYRDMGLDSVIYDTVLATKDASIIDFKGTFDPEHLYISSGYTTHVFLKFDFSKIPDNVILSSVDFILKKDSLNSIVNNNRGQGFYLRNVTTDLNQLPYYLIDSTFAINSNYIVLLTEETKDQLDLFYSTRANVAQNFVQSIINKEIQYGSFFLQYTDETNEISVYALRGKDDSIVSFRPKMILEYYLLPNSRI